MDAPRRMVIRYVLFQIPAAALLVVVLVVIRRWFDITWTTVAVITGLWILKDAALYPLVRRAYEPSRAAVDLVDRRAVTLDALDPSGFVRLGGELWKAVLADPSRPVSAGQSVRVRRRNGLTLVVEPVDESAPYTPP